MDTLNYKKLVLVSLALNIIALVAILYLFNHQPASVAIAKKAPKVDSTGRSVNIAYVNVDTIIEKYNLIDDLQKGFEQQTTVMQKELYGKQQKFEQDVAAFQNNVQAGKLAASVAQQQEQELQQRQQQLMELQQKYSTQLGQKELEMRQHVIDSIMNYLNRQYAGTYDYILGYTAGGGILHANTSYDLTVDVLKDLQKEYANRNKNGIKK